MGQNHVKGFRQHPQAEVVAFADVDPARLAAIGDAQGVAKRYTSAEAMLESEKLDVVSICTPNVFHKPLALKAFEAGCHVLCEKPLAMNAAEGREMLAAAKKAKRRLMINFSFRFNAQSQAMKQQVDSGFLGEIYAGRTVWLRRRGMPRFGGWFGQKKMAGGGPLIDLGVHRLDLALWLMGSPKPAWVMGSTYNKIAGEIAKREGKPFDVEDFAMAMIRFENGATLELESSWASNIREKELMETRLLGTKGGLIQRNLNEGYEFESEFFVEKDGYHFDFKLHAPLPQTYPSMYHLIEAIVNDTPHPATGEEGLRVMEILDAIYESARTGQPVAMGMD